MSTRREVYGPDGRVWTVTRQAEGAAFLARLLRRDGWLIEATTEGPPAETRHWRCRSRAEANALLEKVAMSLRTGSEGPNEPED